MTDLNFARMRINHLPGFAGQSPLSLPHLRSGPEEWGRIAVELVALAPRPHSLEVGQVLGTVYVEAPNPEHTQVHDATVTDVGAAPVALRATDYVTVRGYVDPSRDVQARPQERGSTVKRWDMRYESAVMGMEPEARMVEHLSGQYVLASDYDKLVKQYAELGQGLAEWEPVLTKFLTGLANGNSDDPRICAEAEGLGQYLPQLRALTNQLKDKTNEAE